MPLLLAFSPVIEPLSIRPVNVDKPPSFAISHNHMLPKLPRESLLDLCRRMFVIRHFEENLVPLHDRGVFGGHYHLYVGQEGTGVPAISCLRSDDYLFTTHRNHGHLLARGAEPKPAPRASRWPWFLCVVKR